MGMPVLYGALSGTTVINELVDGMAVPAPSMQLDVNFPDTFGQSLCPQAGETVGSRALAFGYDVTTGCTLQLNRQQLIDMCCMGSSSCAAGVATGTTQYSDASGMPYFLSSFVQG